MKRVTRLCAFLLGLCLSLTWLCLILDTLGTDSGLMLALMRRYAPSETTGLPEDAYAGVCGMITDYLAGNTDEFQYTFVRDGNEYLCFQTHEQTHMADVRSLFVLARTVLLVSLAAVALLLPLLFAFRAHSAQSLRGIRDSSGLLLGLTVGCTLWGMMDFGSFFTAFHHLMFQNLLWLLNPATDLLIRLMPTGFFIAYAGILLVLFLLEPLAAMLVCIRVLRGRRTRAHQIAQ